MSVMERVSPFLSPSSRCYRGFYQLVHGSNGSSAMGASVPLNEQQEVDLDYNKERNYYNESKMKRNSMSRSSSSSSLASAKSSPKVRRDSFLSAYMKNNSGSANSRSSSVSGNFPIYSKLNKDDFYKAYLRQRDVFIRDDEINEEDGNLQKQNHYNNNVIIESKQLNNQHKKHNYREHDHDQTRSKHIKTSPDEIWQSKSPHVAILTPPLRSKLRQEIRPQDEINTTDSTSVQLPKDFIDCSIDHLITLISRMLRSLILLNDNNVPKSVSNPQSESEANGKSSWLTRYHSRTPPSISIPTYLTRLTKFNNFTNATLLTTIYYIDLLSHHYQPFFTLNSWTVHRFLLVGTMLSQKSMEDFFYTNDHYAKVGGVAISELNCLELDFLTRVDWKCMPAKQLENGKSSIKYAKDVLDLYYSQLIQLMGKNVTKGDQNCYEAGGSSKEEDTREYQRQHSVRESSLESKMENSFDNGQDDIEIDETQVEEDDEEDEDDEENYDDEEDNYDSDEDIDYQSPRFPSMAHKQNDGVNLSVGSIGQPSKFNSFGYSVDGSSSPHLKRRYSIQSEDS